jgi:hypothetical protein
MNNFFDQISSLLLFGVIIIAPLAAWMTHVITCISTEAWGFLIAGAIFFPVGIVHGVGIWMGVWP